MGQEDSFQLKDFELLTTLDKLYPNYEITFGLYVNTWPTTKFGCIVQLANKLGNCCEIGQRIPRISLRDVGILTFGTQLNDNGNFYVHEKNLPPEATINKEEWISVAIRQQDIEVNYVSLRYDLIYQT